MASWFDLLIIVFGVISIPLTEFTAHVLSLESKHEPWYIKGFAFFFGLTFLAILLYPLSLVHGSTQPILIVCWGIFMLQIFYRMGFKAGNKKSG
jgi:hypothetical protein